MKLRSIKSKKAQGLNIDMLIIVLLALLALFVGLAIYFNWFGLNDRISLWTGGKANVDDIISKCSYACANSRDYDYNTAKNEVILEDKTKFKATCKEMEGVMERCLDSNKKQVDIVKDDCKDNSHNKWTKNICYNSTSFEIDSQVSTQAVCDALKDGNKAKARTFSIVEICNNGAKVIRGLKTKETCTGKYEWKQVSEAIIKTPCANFS